MKIRITFLLLFISVILIGQSKDNQIASSSKNVEEMSREELFMRGISPKVGEMTKSVNYTRNAIRPSAPKNFVYGKTEGAIIQLNRVSYEGKLGTIQTEFFSIKNLLGQSTEWKIKSTNDNITFDQNKIKLDSEGQKKIRMDIKLPRENEEAKLIFTNEKQDRVEVLIIIDGYDLDESDFENAHSTYLPNKTISIKNRTFVNVKLDTSEKLLRIKKGDQIISFQTVALLINPIDIQQLEPGDYVFEVVDMKTNEIRRCKVKLVNSAQ